MSYYLSFNVLICFVEANPEKFNSRFRNKMFYAGVSAATFFNPSILYLPLPPSIARI